MRVLGIDLTGSESRASGLALLDGSDLEYTKRLNLDSEMEAEAINANVKVVSIDSPLSLPEDPNKIYRDCELTLKRRGIGVYWCLLPSMKNLTMRGIALAAKLREAGLTVIESYPGAAQDILGIPRKQKGIQVLANALAEFGINGNLNVSHDELDAVTAAIVGLSYLDGEYEALGCLILPDKRFRIKEGHHHYWVLKPFKSGIAEANCKCRGVRFFPTVFDRECHAEAVRLNKMLQKGVDPRQTGEKDKKIGVRRYGESFESYQERREL